MQGWIKSLKSNNKQLENLKREKDKKKEKEESCKFLFNMIGRLFSK
ncbi:hypothetical protein [Clostridium magnum]|uniref:Uncharacterized protein n=1 Tax=Clostridium magnum DSM 2767 TaxID=1121326 RepID=A0A162UEN5_9CLOT|nr:hypothetical protein [Clostridium magnum]KZL93820.1 hypothetical protein CLMAG_08720 [Clostridium magnum DSM 2767]SHI08309.1 hypothetical protein SAMN02745944_02376 [Clostridium magnum DSM 2767]